MGSSGSKEAEKDDYKPPALRSKDRYVAREFSAVDSDAAAFDPSADKYDYLIVFTVAKAKEGALGAATVSWERLRDVWMQAIPGEEDKKDRGVRALKAKWAARFGAAPAPTSTAPRPEVEALIRDHIVDVLSRRSGLQLKLSTNLTRNKQFCQIRAPMNLLEQKADQLQYKLKFRPEVDPGKDFWERTDGDIDEKTGRRRYVELLEEQRLISKDRANEILGILYRAGKIGPRDMCVFDEEETTEKHWSRRVHTLERIVDKVKPISNEYPAYASYDRSSPIERHLYDEYPSVRGTTLFLSKDRLYLTKRIIDEVFDFGVLTREEFCGVELVTALHDANYGEMPTADWFLKRWVYFWQAEADRVGAPYVTHPSISKHRSCPFLLRPWAQPLTEIRSYFGEKIAFYFAWLGFYGYYLIYPALAGLIVSGFLLVSGQSDESVGVHPEQIFMGFFIVIWSAYYKESWDIESQYCALKWGTVNFEEEEVDRPQFHGDLAGPKGDRRRVSPVTNQSETYYPAEKRRRTQTVSLLIILIFIILLIIVMVIVFELQYLMYSAGGILGKMTGAVGILQAVLIQVLSFFYGQFADARNDLENYRTQTEFENQLVLKKFLFEIFNNYSALAITAFFKGTYFECTSGLANQENCLGDLKALLQSIIGTRFALAMYSASEERVNRLMEAVIPPKLQQDKDDDDDDEEESDAEGKNANAEDLENKQTQQEAQRFESELQLKDYEGTFDDYAEIVLQMGLVSMFTLGWYLVPTFGVLEVLVQIRVDAYKLAHQTKRPDPSPAESVGTWGVLMESMGLLAVYANAGIIVFTTRSFSRYSSLQKLLIFFVLEQIALVLKVVTHASIVDVPTDLYEKKRRNDHVVKRHKIVLFDDDDAADVSGGGIKDSDLLDDDEKRRRAARRQASRPGFLEGAADVEQKKEAERKRLADIAKRSSDLAVQRGAVDPDLLDVASLKPEKLTRLNQQRLEFLRRKLLTVDKDIALLRNQYKVANKHEVFRPKLGVSYSRKDPKLALGLLTATLDEAKNVGTADRPIINPKTIRVIAHVRDDAKATVGPPPQVSKPARRPKYVVDEYFGERLLFGHTFSLAPIGKAVGAVLHLELIEERGKDEGPGSDDDDAAAGSAGSAGMINEGPATQRRKGFAELPLRDLMDQKPHKDVILRVKPPGTLEDDGVDDDLDLDPTVEPHLKLNAQFQYSKLVPIKTRILELLTEQKKLHRDVTNLQLGERPDNKWEFPDQRNNDDDDDDDDDQKEEDDDADDLA